EECLSNSYVIPFSISKRMFGSMLLAARLKRWQRMSKVLAAEHDLVLLDDEVRECRQLAVDQILGMLRKGRSAQCTSADPTGARTPPVGGGLGARLKRRGDLGTPERERVVRQSQDAFRKAIHGRLDLPPLPELPDRTSERA